MKAKFKFRMTKGLAKATREETKSAAFAGYCYLRDRICEVFQLRHVAIPGRDPAQERARRRADLRDKIKKARILLGINDRMQNLIWKRRWRA